MTPLTADVVTEIDLTSPVDRLLAGTASVFDLDEREQQRLRTQLVLDAVEYHLERCPPYRAYVDRVGWDGDLDNVPVIPTEVFKRNPVLSVAVHDVVRWCDSSGTQGELSTVGRDRLSLERLLGSVRAGLTLIDDWHEHEIEVVNLGPPRVEAGRWWFGYVMSLVELLFPTTHWATRTRFDPDAAVGAVSRLLDEVPHVGVVGPPFLVLELARAATARGLRCDERVTVVTGGGWKTRSGRVTPHELRETVSDALGLASDGQIRDAFNQVELNSVLFECEAHRKHVPVWVHVVARDPRGFRPLPPGETGVLTYLDASATSYPAFIAADDLGSIEAEPCPCGRPGPTLVLDRRILTVEARGCALTLDQRFEEPG